MGIDSLATAKKKEYFSDKKGERIYYLPIYKNISF